MAGGSQRQKVDSGPLDLQVLGPSLRSETPAAHLPRAPRLLTGIGARNHGFWLVGGHAPSRSLGSQGDNSGDHGSLVPQNGGLAGKGDTKRCRASRAGRPKPGADPLLTLGSLRHPHEARPLPQGQAQPQGWAEHGAWPQGPTEAVAEGVRRTDNELRSLSATSRASVGWRTGPSPSHSPALLPNAGDTVTTHGQIRPRTGLWAGRQGSPQRADPRRGHASPKRCSQRRHRET